MRAGPLLLLALLGAVPASAQGGATGGTLAGFQLPSGRLACLYDASAPQASIRCDVLGATFKAPRPAGCTLAWGDSLGLNAGGRPFLVCHGDTVLDPAAPVLAYGSVWRRGGLTCRSSTTGVRCANAAGHGFELARARYRLF